MSDLKTDLKYPNGKCFLLLEKMGCSLLFLRSISPQNFYITPPTWLFSAWDIGSATCNWGCWDLSTLNVSQPHVREYLVTDMLPCAPFLLPARAPWFLLQRQPLLVSRWGIPDSPQSGFQVRALRNKMLVWQFVSWYPPIGQVKCSKQVLVEYCAVFSILWQDKSVHHRRSDLSLGSLQEIWICL